jgi:beta-glucosidase
METKNMPQATYTFPIGFLWGTATAAHQVEGQNTNNNWSAWEAQPGRILNGDKSGLACDWWGGRWKEDMDRAAETGQNAHRMSVEWSRIQPAPDRWDENALDHYREMLRGMRDRKITVMVTLHHFTDPLWLVEMGGWENAQTPALFAAFVRKTVEALKDYTNLWCTINEPNVYAYSGYLGTAFPPGKNDLKTAFNVMRNMVLGHAQAYKVIHSIQPEARVGIASHYRRFDPARPWFPLDALSANLQAKAFNHSFCDALTSGKLNFAFYNASIPEAQKTQDFIGLNYYTTDEVSFDLSSPGTLFGKNAFPKNAELSINGFLANTPLGMFKALNWARSYGLPVLVTENGVEDNDDRLRPDYLVQHLHQIWRGVNFSWPIKGYFHWSLIDNFEWERGWSQRFGLWGLDTNTQARIRRPSVDLYASICQENSISHAAVEKFAPKSLPKLYPE